jgi:hypothetical protein
MSISVDAAIRIDRSTVQSVYTWKSTRSPSSARAPSARHVSTWPSPRHRPPHLSFTPAHHKPRDRSHKPTHAMVRSQTQLRSWITLTITHHKTNYKGTYLHYNVKTFCALKFLSNPAWSMHLCVKFVVQSVRLSLHDAARIVDVLI